jgi:hypothetical protein
MKRSPRLLLRNSGGYGHGGRVRLRAAAVGATLIGVTLLSGCKKDPEVRRYIDGPLAVYLDSLTRQLCRVRAAAAPQVGEGNDLCPPEGDGYKPPPSNGKP